jgi:ribose transport system permease protein
MTKTSLAKRLDGFANKLLSKNGSGVLLMLVLIIVLVSILAPVVTGGRFFTADNIIKIFRQVTVVGIISCAATVVMLTGNIDLSVGAMLTLTGCIAATTIQYGFFPMLVATLGTGAVCGLINGALVSGLKLNPFITTLATQNIFQAVVYFYTKSQYLIPESNKYFEFVGKGYIFGFLPMPVVMLILIAAIYWFVLSCTPLGMRIFAIGANRTCARFSGVKTRLDILIAYTLTGLTTAIAAIVMVSRVMSAQSQMGGGYEFDVITAIVLGGTSMWGGKGSIPGTLLGVLFVGVLSNSFVLLGLNTNLQWLIQGAILILALKFDIEKERRLSP